MADISTKYIDHIRNQIGDENLAEFLQYCNLPLRRSIRINTLKISQQKFFKRVDKYGWQLQAIPWCNNGYWLTRPDEEENRLALGNTFEHLAGLFYIQEASSMLPAEALMFGLKESNKSAEKILDMAAAPGSKTTHLAALTKNQSLIIANELSASRLKSLHASVRRCGLTNYCLSHRDGKDFGVLSEQQFDAILLDAPCGGEGTVRKDPTALKHWQAEDLEFLSTLQKQLIESAFKALKPGGVLVYSTCTISTEENQQVCQFLMQQQACSVISLQQLFYGAEKVTTAEGYLQVLPQDFDSGGFFVACFRKSTSSDQLPLSTAVEVSGNWQYINLKILQQFENYLASQFDFDSGQLNGNFLIRENHKIQQIWLFPKHLDNQLLQSIKPKRSGIRLAEMRLIKNLPQFKLTHEFIIAFGHLFDGNCFAANYSEARDFLIGKDLQKNQSPLQSGECLVTYDGNPLGLAKLINNRIKNNLPRELIKDKLQWLTIAT